eukprot:PITA_10030
MKIVSWNCRGMGSRIKEEAIRSLIRIETPDILLIQETKLEDSIFLQASKKLWNKCEAKAISARGASGGGLVPVDQVTAAARASTCAYSTVASKFVTNYRVDKSKEGSPRSCSIIFAILEPTRDLNLTLLLAYKRGGNIVRDLEREWAEDLIQDWDLLDIKPIYSKYTWTNKRIGPGHITTRLDRFLIQSSFLLLGLETRVHILPCITSDHKPIKLELVFQLNLGPIPFKFSPLWAKESDFMQVVKGTWVQPVKGSPFFI